MSVQVSSLHPIPLTKDTVSTASGPICVSGAVGAPDTSKISCVAALHPLSRSKHTNTAAKIAFLNTNTPLFFVWYHQLFFFRYHFIYCIIYKCCCQHEKKIQPPT